MGSACAKEQQPGEPAVVYGGASKIAAAAIKASRRHAPAQGSPSKGAELYAPSQGAREYAEKQRQEQRALEAARAQEARDARDSVQFAEAPTVVAAVAAQQPVEAPWPSEEAFAAAAGEKKKSRARRRHSSEGEKNKGDGPRVRHSRRRHSSVAREESSSASNTRAAEKTVWVGGLPHSIASAALQDPSALMDLMKVFGDVVSVTVRLKRGELKSWAFATFAARESADRASEVGAVTASDDHGKAVLLVIKKAELEKELGKESTGALASTWRSQERKVAAAISIQRVVRGVRSRSKEKEKKRRAGKRRSSSEKS